MRTPNTQCLLCAKPLYRRPYEMAKVRYAACMACRSEAQKVSGIPRADSRVEREPIPITDRPFGVPLCTGNDNAR